MTYIAVCLNGIEEVTEKEIKGKKIFPGRVEFNGKIKEFRSVNKIYKLLKRFQFKEKEDILKEFKKLKIKIKKRFKIDCDREGKHDFKSVDVEKLIGVYLQKKSFELDFKEPETIIFIDILYNDCLIGLLVKDELQKRDYRVKLNPDTLNPCLAFTALKLCDYKKGDILVDPSCRDGIIAIEAALMKKGKVYGFDKNTRNARINAKVAKVNIDLSHNEVDWLDTTFKKNAVKVVSYLPSISKRNKEDDIRRFYSELVHQLDYIVKDKFVFIVRKPELFKIYVNRFKFERELTVTIGADSFTILSYKKNI